jgi:hypothetical protein
MHVHVPEHPLVNFVSCRNTGIEPPLLSTFVSGACTADGKPRSVNYKTRYINGHYAAATELAWLVQFLLVLRGTRSTRN